MKNISIFLAVLLLASCSTTGMSSGNSMNGNSSAGYTTQPAGSIYPNGSSDVYFGD